MSKTSSLDDNCRTEADAHPRPSNDNQCGGNAQSPFEVMATSRPTTETKTLPELEEKSDVRPAEEKTGNHSRQMMDQNDTTDVSHQMLEVMKTLAINIEHITQRIGTLEYQVNSSDRRKVNSTLTVNDFNSTEVGSPEDRSTSSNPFDHPNSDQGNSNEYQTFNTQMGLTNTPTTERHPTIWGDGIGNTENVSTQGPDSGSTTTVVDSRAKSFSRDKHAMLQNLNSSGETAMDDLDRIIADSPDEGISTSQHISLGSLIRVLMGTEINTNGNKVPTQQAAVMLSTYETLKTNLMEQKRTVRETIRENIDKKKLIGQIVDAMSDDNATPASVYNALWGIFRSVYKTTGVLTDAELNQCTLAQAMLPESIFMLKLYTNMIHITPENEARPITATDMDHSAGDILGWQRLQTLRAQVVESMKNSGESRHLALDIFETCIGKVHSMDDIDDPVGLSIARKKVGKVAAALLGSSYFSGAQEEELLAAVKEVFETMESLFSDAVDKMKSSAAAGRDVPNITQAYLGLTNGGKVKPYAWYPALDSTAPRTRSFGNLPLSPLVLALQLPMNWMGMFLYKCVLAAPHSIGLYASRIRLSSLYLTNFHHQLVDIPPDELKSVFVKGLVTDWINVATQVCKGADPLGFTKYNPEDSDDASFLEGLQAPRGKPVYPVLLEIMECIYHIYRTSNNHAHMELKTFLQQVHDGYRAWVNAGTPPHPSPEHTQILTLATRKNFNRVITWIDEFNPVGSGSMTLPKVKRTITDLGRLTGPKLAEVNATVNQRTGKNPESDRGRSRFTTDVNGRRRSNSLGAASGPRMSGELSEKEKEDFYDAEAILIQLPELKDYLLPKRELNHGVKARPIVVPPAHVRHSLSKDNYYLLRTYTNVLGNRLGFKDKSDNMAEWIQERRAKNLDTSI